MLGYVFSGRPQGWLCRQDFLILSTRNIWRRSLMMNEKNLHTTPLWSNTHYPIFCYLFWRLHSLSPSSETALKTKDYAVKHSVSTFNIQIYLSWIQMFSHTQSPLPLLHQKPSLLSIAKSTLVVTPDHCLFYPPTHTLIYTVTTRAGWIWGEPWRQPVPGLSLGFTRNWMT